MTSIEHLMSCKKKGCTVCEPKPKKEAEEATQAASVPSTYLDSQRS